MDASGDKPESQRSLGPRLEQRIDQCLLNGCRGGLCAVRLAVLDDCLAQTAQGIAHRRRVHLDNAVHQARHEAIVALENPAGSPLARVKERHAPHVVVVGT
jgi:hypothetical protein